METYRLFFLDNQSHIAAVNIIEAANDEAASVEASKLLNDQQKYRIAELWQLGRRIVLLGL